jgi:hypothetical protein
MNTKRSTAVVLVVVASLAGCSSASSPAAEPPVTLKDVQAPDGTALKQVTLVEHAVQRLGIRTGTVHQARVSVDGVAGTHKVVPYTAVVYDSNGSTWAYANVSERTYLRASITISSIQGDVAVLTKGPADGTAVVTQGAPELLGAEYEISGEQ